MNWEILKALFLRFCHCFRHFHRGSTYSMINCVGPLTISKKYRYIGCSDCGKVFYNGKDYCKNCNLFCASLGDGHRHREPDNCTQWLCNDGACPFDKEIQEKIKATKMIRELIG